LNSALAPGTRVGPYVVDTYLGGGGFGAVWRGHDESTGELVAIKVLTGAASNADTAAIRADVELLAAAASARSPHVVRVLGGGVDPMPYIAMEYVDGTDLSVLLRDNARLPVERTIEVGLAIADALRALNEAGIVHRDIKPANVMVDKDGVIKLADFGIAKIVGYETVTMTGQIALTMAYAAPEVWDEEDASYGRPSHKSDLYAMGTLLFQCLAGAPPFTGSYGTLFRAHRERPPDITALPAGIPPSLREVIRRCLAKRQADRPDSAAECLRMLRRAAVEHEEMNGFPPASEPSRLGHWLRESPHPTQPWAWRCRHESSGATATVEVHFVDSVDDGAVYRKAIAANPALVGLGAERLIETNRLILRPGEEWTGAPDGQFQFWLARDEQPPVPPPALVTAAMLRQAAADLVALVEAAGREGVALSFGADDVSLQTDGRVRLLRPGMGVAGADATASALAYLQSLPLDDAARELLSRARDLESIAPARQTLGQASIGRDAGSVQEESYGESLQVCSRCKSPVSPGEAFCGSCGQRLGRRSEPLCPRCRGPVGQDDPFCGSCGQRLGFGAAPSACSRCNGPVAANDIFCGSCGHPVGT
jgi:hypothetical protein